MTRPIRVSENKSVSVKPHSKIEIETMDQQAKSLVRKGQLTRTGKPKGIVQDESVKKEKEISMKDVVKVPAWADALSEKGAVKSAADIESKKNTELSRIELLDIKGETIKATEQEEEIKEESTDDSDDADKVDEVVKVKRKRRRRAELEGE